MRISDWSSDVCSSDLPFIVAAGDGTITALGTVFDVALERDDRVVVQLLNGALDVRVPAAAVSGTAPIRLAPGQQLVFRAEKASAPVKVTSSPDRKSVGTGKSVSVRVDLRGSRIIKNKT